MTAEPKASNEGCGDPCKGKPFQYLDAIPPTDYKGTQAAWMIGLQERGIWDGTGFHGDEEISCCDWWSLLEACDR